MAEARKYRPTSRKLEGARARGEVPQSREFCSAIVLLVACVVLYTGRDVIYSRLTRLFSVVLDTFQSVGVTQPEEVLSSLFYIGLSILIPFWVFIFISAFVANFLQVGPLLSLIPVTKGLSRLDPIKGVERIFNKWVILDILIQLLKLCALIWVAFVSLREGFPGLVSLMRGGVQRAVVVLTNWAFIFLIRITCLYLIFALFDVFYQRYRYLQMQKMSRREIEEERKQSEVHPQIRERNRSLYRDAFRHADLPEMKKALLVLLGPFDRVVALCGDDEEMPNQRFRIEARGSGATAQHMIKVALGRSIPVVRDAALVEALSIYEIGEVVEENHTEAIANQLDRVKAQDGLSE